MPKKNDQEGPDRNLSIENAKIILRNFSGKEMRFNPEGRRNFGVLLDKEMAKQLEEDGWRIRWLKPRDPGDEEQPWLKVEVSYKFVPPRITVISNVKTILNERTVGQLDWADLEVVDLIIRPYNWEVNGKHGTKAYLKTMYATTAVDEFEAKYRDVPSKDTVFFDDDDGPDDF